MVSVMSAMSVVWRVLRGWKLNFALSIDIVAFVSIARVLSRSHACLSFVWKMGMRCGICFPNCIQCQLLMSLTGGIFR